MPKKLNEKEKLGLEIIGDLQYLFGKVDWRKIMLDTKSRDVLKNISIKIKDLALKN